MVDAPADSFEADLALQNKQRTILLREAHPWSQYKCEPRQHQNKGVDSFVFAVLRQLCLQAAWLAKHVFSTTGTSSCILISSSPPGRRSVLRAHGEKAGLLILEPHDLEVSPLARDQNAVPAICRHFLTNLILGHGAIACNE